MNAAVGCSLQLLLTLIVALTEQRNSAGDDETTQASCGRTSSDIVSIEMYTVDHLGKPTNTRMICTRRLCRPIIINAPGNTFMEDLSVFDTKRRCNGSDVLMEDTYAGETGRRDSNTFSTTVVSAVLQQPVPQIANTVASGRERLASALYSAQLVTLFDAADMFRCEQIMTCDDILNGGD